MGSSCRTQGLSYLFTLGRAVGVTDILGASGNRSPQLET